MLDENLLNRVRRAASVDELMHIADEQHYAMDQKQAEALYKRFHMEGELSDDELDQVSGGCSTVVDGHEYMTVTLYTDCLCGFGNRPCPDCVYCEWHNGLRCCMYKPLS